MKPNHDELIRLAKEAGGGLALTMSSNPRISNAMFSGKSLEHFADLVIADFLQRTGQYVTNDASREAALEQARAEEREAILRTAPGDWGAAYDTFKAGKALPNDAPALQYAFAAGMLLEREECAKLCEETDIEQFTHCSVLHDDGRITLANAAAAIRARRMP